MLKPDSRKACVCYYYLPARYGNNAEIIKTLYSQNNTISVPMWEENIMLEPFHIRYITPEEVQYYNGVEVWEVFQSWDELCAEEQKCEVEENELKILEHFRDSLTLSKSMVA